MATAIPAVAVPPQAAPSTSVLELAGFEERWAAWLAKGAARDRAVRRKMAVAAPIVLAVAAVVIYVLGR